MFKKNSDKQIKDFLNSYPEQRKELALTLNEFISKTLPKLKPYLVGKMIGYGKFEYQNSKKEIVEWPIVTLAIQKQYLSLYLNSVKDGVYVAEKFRNKLGKVKIGRSCIKLKSLQEINLPVLKEVLIEAAKNPGFSG